MHCGTLVGTFLDFPIQIGDFGLNDPKSTKMETPRSPWKLGGMYGGLGIGHVVLKKRLLQKINWNEIKSCFFGFQNLVWQLHINKKVWCMNILWSFKVIWDGDRILGWPFFQLSLLKFPSPTKFLLVWFRKIL